ncbi:MAG: hypothetical protein RSF67_09615, partial [Clostridia bacterium]
PILCVGGEDPTMACNQYTTSLGNSGQAFKTNKEAWNWATSVWHDDKSEWYMNSFMCHTIWYNLPNGKSYQMWTVEFTK